MVDLGGVHALDGLTREEVRASNRALVCPSEFLQCVGSLLASPKGSKRRFASHNDLMFPPPRNVPRQMTRLRRRLDSSASWMT